MFAVLLKFRLFPSTGNWILGLSVNRSSEPDIIEEGLESDIVSVERRRSFDNVSSPSMSDSKKSSKSRLRRGLTRSSFRFRRVKPSKVPAKVQVNGDAPVMEKTGFVSSVLNKLRPLKKRAPSKV